MRFTPSPPPIGSNTINRELEIGPTSCRSHEIPKSTLATGGGASIEYEHFGFHDGVSQPVIRGNAAVLEGGSAPRHRRARRIYLGYRKNQNYYPPTATVSAKTDPGG